ncbi:N-acylneuraminate cytidylyltransferase [Deferrisoma camini]|uniref:N-acylneuraminate cytidylyltransferase n=1 Tax=Deferrisoma camini TaxID=1035120 RepID=UPI000A0167E4|nr:N-acylneuraminate cytidylyltransferase [Deferrisoma camini]
MSLQPPLGSQVPRAIALVPLRGGSKGIPGKNIKPIAGRPLCAWVLEAAHAAGIFAEVVVSTDSEEIASVVAQHSPDTRILRRPAELATDTASTEAVMLHAADHFEFSHLATIQATSPLTTGKDLANAFRRMVDGNYDSVVTGVRVRRFFWTSDGTPLNYNPANRPMRQQFRGTVMENGAFYYTRRELLLSERCRLGGKILVFEMPPETAVELDEPEDWAKVESLLRRKILPARIGRVGLLVVDVDGTLTDAGMYWSAQGDTLKKFNTRDAMGLERVRRSGIEVAIITSEKSPIVAARARKLGITRCHLGIREKLPVLESLAAELGLSLEEVAYIGDDLNDLPCLERVGFGACPADAVSDVRATVDYVSTFPGGAGAVRDVCDTLIEARENRVERMNIRALP